MGRPSARGDDRQCWLFWLIAAFRSFSRLPCGDGAWPLGAPAHPWFYVLAGFELADGGVLVRPARRRGYRTLLKQIPLMPVYWLLISAAAYWALRQFMTARFEWEKTEHGLRPRRTPPAC